MCCRSTISDVLSVRTLGLTLRVSGSVQMGIKIVCAVNGTSTKTPAYSRSRALIAERTDPGVVVLASFFEVLVVADESRRPRRPVDMRLPLAGELADPPGQV